MRTDLIHGTLRGAALLLLAGLLAGPATLPARAAPAEGDPAPGELGSRQLDDRRDAFLTALREVERGQRDARGVDAWADHPLHPWMRQAWLRHHIARVQPDEAEAFLAEWAGEAPGEAFRVAWLRELARRGQWEAFTRSYTAQSDDTLRCTWLQARMSLGDIGEDWRAAALEAWTVGRSMPAACDPVFTALRTSGALTAEVRWARWTLALEAGEAAIMRAAASGLSADDQALASRYAAFVADPSGSTEGWPRDGRSRAIALRGLATLARANPDAAEARLAELGPALGFTDDDTARARYDIALWTVASYLPGAAGRLAAVPPSAYDERLHEWQAREAMARGDDAATLAAIARMPAAQRNDPRWRWFEARMLERLGRADEAAPIFEEVARTATFHGFLAADRLDRPYALCPLDVRPADPAAMALRGDPRVLRAIEAFRADRMGWAYAEWAVLMRRLSPAERVAAVALAREARWYDRGIFALARDPATMDEELRYYRLRFPLHHGATIRRESAAHDIDAAWVAAEIRAESAWMPRARSHADARGLMQLLPRTGQATAARIDRPWTGVESLYEPRTNIALGTAYLRQMLEENDGKPYYAIAAYNAGPAPIARWRAAREAFDPDLFIETISYRETREYVARVLAFSVIYDWRLHGDAVPMAHRLAGTPTRRGERRGFACPAPLPAPPAAAPAAAQAPEVTP